MCVDRFHIVSLFLSNPCTPSTLCKETFVYFVCPTEIPQPPFAWKYYITNSGSHSHIRPHYQYTKNETTRSWSERERKRDTRTHPKARLRWKESERERGRSPQKGMLYRSVATNSRPNSRPNSLHLSAQKNPALREGERQRKKYGERESEVYWDRNDRDRVRKKEKGTESTMWHVLHT